MIPTPRTPTPFKNALAAQEKMHGPVKMEVRGRLLSAETTSSCCWPIVSGLRRKPVSMTIASFRSPCRDYPGTPLLLTLIAYRAFYLILFSYRSANNLKHRKVIVGHVSLYSFCSEESLCVAKSN